MPKQDISQSPEARWLYRYTDIAREHANLIEQYERLQMRATSPAGPKLDGMPRAPGFNSDALSLSVAAIVDLEQEITEVAEEATAIRRETEKAIKMIRSGDNAANKRAVLRARYVIMLKFADVNEFLFGDQEDFLEKEDSYLRRIFNLHRAAIEDLQEILRSGQFPSFAEYDKKNAEEEETGNEQSADET